MRFGKCPDCGHLKFLTKHSKTGGHQPPFIRICRTCHDEREGMRSPKKKYNKKYQRGTKRQHKKGWRKK